jgi:hypothetical protein
MCIEGDDVDCDCDCDCEFDGEILLRLDDGSAIARVDQDQLWTVVEVDSLM